MSDKFSRCGQRRAQFSPLPEFRAYSRKLGSIRARDFANFPARYCRCLIRPENGYKTPA
jgi:hypothetical protein